MLVDSETLELSNEPTVAMGAMANPAAGIPDQDPSAQKVTWFTTRNNPTFVKPVPSNLTRSQTQWAGQSSESIKLFGVLT